jgi:hypothetical protein
VSHRDEADDMANEEKSAVGYARPPKQTRFSKGQSGNPAGRPKSLPSFKSELAQELQQPFAFLEGGKTSQVTKQRALIKSLMAAAIDGDGRAVSALLSCMRHYNIGVDEDRAPEVDVKDLEFLQTYIDGERTRLAQEAPSAETSDDPDTAK